MTFAYGHNARFQVHIDGTDDEGRGRGHLGDVDVAVRGGSPGDTCTVRTERAFKTRKLIQARAESFEERGEHHGEKVCTHFGPCPACPMAAFSHEYEIAVKHARAVQAAADASIDPSLVEPVRTGRRFGVRQKVKLTVRGDGKPLTLGMYAPHTHRLSDATRCAIAHPDIQEAALRVQAVLREQMAHANTEARPGILAVVLRVYTDGVRAVVVSRVPLADKVFDVLCALVEDDVLIAVSERIDGDAGNRLTGGTIQRQFGEPRGIPLEGGPPVPVDAFCQPSPILARRLYDSVARWLTEVSSPAIDLYAGTGGFSRALKRAGALDVRAVELANGMEDALRESADSTVMGDVGDVLQHLVDQRESSWQSGAVVADPPRKGLGTDVVESLRWLCPQRLCLVSCDADAAARDYRLLETAGFTLEHITPWDLFPGTVQVELVSFWKGPTSR